MSNITIKEGVFTKEVVFNSDGTVSTSDLFFSSTFPNIESFLSQEIEETKELALFLLTI